MTDGTKRFQQLDLNLGRALAALACLAVSAGCAAQPGPRMAAQAEQARVQVVGRGVVESDREGIDCGVATEGEATMCEARFRDYDNTLLLARAAPGWRFVRWTTSPYDAIDDRGVVSHFGLGRVGFVYVAEFAPVR